MFRRQRKGEERERGDVDAALLVVVVVVVHVKRSPVISAVFSLPLCLLRVLCCQSVMNCSHRGLFLWFVFLLDVDDGDGSSSSSSSK